MAEIKPIGLELSLDEQTAQGNYVNLAVITHSHSEFIMDFATVLPNVKKAHVKSRLIMTPEHAKRLLYSLQENISRYEQAMGEIKVGKPQGPDTGHKMGMA